MLCGWVVLFQDIAKIFVKMHSVAAPKPRLEQRDGRGVGDPRLLVWCVVHRIGRGLGQKIQRRPCVSINCSGT